MSAKLLLITLVLSVTPVVRQTGRLPSQDDFLQTNDTEIATIRWLRRKCVGL
jgi:hypothetical protein